MQQMGCPSTQLTRRNAKSFFIKKLIVVFSTKTAKCQQNFCSTSRKLSGLSREIRNSYFFITKFSKFSLWKGVYRYLPKTFHGRQYLIRLRALISLTSSAEQFIPLDVWSSNPTGTFLPGVFTKGGVEGADPS